jgi:hypothetical protein
MVIDTSAEILFSKAAIICKTNKAITSSHSMP